MTDAPDTPDLFIRPEAPLYEIAVLGAAAAALAVFYLLARHAARAALAANLSTSLIDSEKKGGLQ